MFLVAILIAFAGLQLWSYSNPFHRDQWFERWVDFLNNAKGVKRAGLFKTLISLLLPTALVGGIAMLLGKVSVILWLLFASFILLYSLGRGKFVEVFLNYLDAVNARNWDRAMFHFNELGFQLSEQGSDDENDEGKQGDSDKLVSRDDWIHLNTQALNQAAYKAFERLFAVIFWFVLFGPAGAFGYRLSFLLAQDRRSSNGLSSPYARHWLWVIEWPAVRLMAASFALTGNFVGCIERGRKLLTCTDSDTSAVLCEAILGALSLDSHASVIDVTARELEAMQQLLNRTLWLWMLALAVLSFF